MKHEKQILLAAFKKDADGIFTRMEGQHMIYRLRDAIHLSLKSRK